MGSNFKNKQTAPNHNKWQTPNLPFRPNEHT